MNDLKPCPFCGSEPEFPEVNEVYGTCYDAGCNDCGVATISIQIIDCFDYEETPSRKDASNSWDKESSKYGDEFIEVARSEAISQWNTRAIPSTHRVVSVELLEVCEYALRHKSCVKDADQLRAIIDNKERS